MQQQFPADTNFCFISGMLAWRECATWPQATHAHCCPDELRRALQNPVEMPDLARFDSMIDVNHSNCMACLAPQRYALELTWDAGRGARFERRRTDDAPSGILKMRQTQEGGMNILVTTDSYSCPYPLSRLLSYLDRKSTRLNSSP